MGKQVIFLLKKNDNNLEYMYFLKVEIHTQMKPHIILCN